MEMQAANCSLAGHVDNAPVRGAGMRPHIIGTRGQQQGSKRQVGGSRGDMGLGGKAGGEGVRASGVQYMKRLRNLTSGRGILPGVARLLVADS